jgi:hypothetical protein
MALTEQGPFVIDYGDGEDDEIKWSIRLDSPDRTARRLVARPIALASETTAARVATAWRWVFPGNDETDDRALGRNRRPRYQARTDGADPYPERLATLTQARSPESGAYANRWTVAMLDGALRSAESGENVPLIG